MLDEDDVGHEYVNCKPSGTGESYCKKKSDKCIPDQPGARNRDGHAGGEVRVLLMPSTHVVHILRWF